MNKANISTGKKGGNRFLEAIGTKEQWLASKAIQRFGLISISSMILAHGQASRQSRLARPPTPSTYSILRPPYSVEDLERSSQIISRATRSCHCRDSTYVKPRLYPWQFITANNNSLFLQTCSSSQTSGKFGHKLYFCHKIGKFQRR